MTELETKIDAEEFNDELSDEALDRAEGACLLCGSLQLRRVRLNVSDGIAAAVHADE
jgi:hypothetical protein